MNPDRLPTVAVVGSGAAGLCAAIEAAAAGARVVIVTKSLYAQQRFRWVSQGGCTWKTNAFNAAVRDDDSPALHAADTLAGGQHAGNPALVEVLCRGAVEVIPWLEALGLQLERQRNGAPATRPYGGCTVPRGVYVEDKLGFHVQRVLVERVQREVAAGRIEMVSEVRAQRVLRGGAGEVAGLEYLDPGTLEILRLPASAVVLADGGGAFTYAPTAVSRDKTCDGMLMALDAGASLVDLEFVQFHPTGLATEVVTYDGALIGENARFHGARLLNRDGRQFMFDYHPQGEMATRDEVARGIFREILAGRAYADRSVILDLASCREMILTTFPALRERLEHAGYDLRHEERIFVRPTAHFMMGGVKIDRHGAAGVRGLFAAGETAGGVHGANRLGGNGLAEALVFGRVAGLAAAEEALSRGAGPAIAGGGERQSLRVAAGGRHHPEVLLDELRRLMYVQAGPVRSSESLRAAVADVERLEEQSRLTLVGSGAQAAAAVQGQLDLRNALRIGRLIVEGALRRQESRGAHYRTDYPRPQPDFVSHAVALGAGGGERVWSESAAFGRPDSGAGGGE